MRQTWTKDDIEKRIDLLRSESPYDYEKVNILDKILRDLNTKHVFGKSKVDKKVFFYLLDKFKLDYFDNSFIKMIDYIAPRLVKLNLDVSEISSDYESYESVQDRCKSFFKCTSKYEFNFFRRIMLNNRERFSLYRERSLSFSGRTYYLADNDFYVLINGCNSLHEMTILIHEIKHIENMYKGYNNGSMLYEELPSLLYQLYSLDYLIYHNEDCDTANELLRRHFIKYISMMLYIKNKSDIIRKLLTDEGFYNNIHENYDIYYEEYNLGEVFNVLRFGIRDLEVGYVVSFLASVDIYLNCTQNNAENAISGYLFGLYKIRPHMLDNSISYFESVLGVKDSYDKNQHKILI